MPPWASCSEYLCGVFHMSLGCRWAGYKIFLHCLCVQVWCSLEEACVDCFEYPHDWWFTKALVREFALLIFVVRAYENPAVSTMGLRWARPKQGPGCGWIGNWWLSIICALWGHSITHSKVVFAISSLMMGRVHKSVVRFLYPCKIMLFS